MSDSLIIIPTYNEKENIERILRRVFSLEKSFHVLIVDDGSPDGTAEIVKNLQNEFDGLHIKERSGKLGLGTAYIDGFRWALKTNYQFIYVTAAHANKNDLKVKILECFNFSISISKMNITFFKINFNHLSKLCFTSLKTLYFPF